MSRVSILLLYNISILLLTDIGLFLIQAPVNDTAFGIPAHTPRYAGTSVVKKYVFRSGIILREKLST